jgi:uncharacterized membrane protein
MEDEMAGHVKLFGHPVHQMLIVFPLGLLGSSVVFDAIQRVRGGGWSQAAWYMIAAGVVAGLVAAVFGFIDWLGIPPHTRAKRIGLWHACGNVVVLLLFATSWLLRRDSPAAPPLLAFLVALAGLALACVTGWLGGELVDRLGIGVDAGAHADAPSSLKGPAIRTG